MRFISYPLGLVSILSLHVALTILSCGGGGGSGGVDPGGEGKTPELPLADVQTLDYGSDGVTANPDSPDPVKDSADEAIAAETDSTEMTGPDMPDASSTVASVGPGGGTVNGPAGWRVEVPPGATAGEVDVEMSLAGNLPDGILTGDETPVGKTLRLTVAGKVGKSPLVLSSPSPETPLVIEAPTSGDAQGSKLGRYAIVLVPGLQAVPAWGNVEDGVLRVPLLMVPGQVDIQVVDSTVYEKTPAIPAPVFPLAFGVTPDAPWKNKTFEVIRESETTPEELADHARALLEEAAKVFSGWGLKNPWLVQSDGMYVAVVKDMEDKGKYDDEPFAYLGPLVITPSAVTGVIYLDSYRKGGYYNDGGGVVYRFPDSTPAHELFHAAFRGYGLSSCEETGAKWGWACDGADCCAVVLDQAPTSGYNEGLAMAIGHVVALETKSADGPLASDCRHHKLDWPLAKGNEDWEDVPSLYGAGDFFIWLARTYNAGSLDFVDLLIGALASDGTDYPDLDAALKEILPTCGGLASAHREFQFQRAFQRSDEVEIGGKKVIASRLRGLPADPDCAAIRDDSSWELIEGLFTEGGIAKIKPVTWETASAVFDKIAPLTGRAVVVTANPLALDVTVKLTGAGGEPLPSDISARAYQGSKYLDIEDGLLVYSKAGFDPGLDAVILLHDDQVTGNAPIFHSVEVNTAVASKPVCVPDCAGKECGDDGCVGVCKPGCDKDKEVCVDGNCVPISECGEVTADGMCDGNVLIYCAGGSLVQEDCSLAGKQCAPDLAAGKYACLSPAEDKPPAGSIAAPVDGTMIEGDFDVTIEANDDIGLAKVTIIVAFLDGEVYKESTVPVGKTLQWTTKQIPTEGWKPGNGWIALWVSDGVNEPVEADVVLFTFEAGCVPDCTGKECGEDGCGGECLPGCGGPEGACVGGMCVGDQPPTGFIGEPEKGAIVYGDFSIKVTAEDDVGVISIAVGIEPINMWAYSEDIGGSKYVWRNILVETNDWISSQGLPIMITLVVSDGVHPPVVADQTFIFWASSCVPGCTMKMCGPDGCGGECAPGCKPGDTCDAKGQCVASAGKCWEKYFTQQIGDVVPMDDGGYFLVGGKAVQDPAPAQLYWIGRTDSAGSMLWEKAYEELAPPPDPVSGVAIAKWTSAARLGEDGLLVAGMTTPFPEGEVPPPLYASISASGVMSWKKDIPVTGLLFGIPLVSGCCGGDVTVVADIDKPEPLGDRLMIRRVHPQGGTVWDLEYSASPDWSSPTAVFGTTDGGVLVVANTWKGNQSYADHLLLKYSQDGGLAWEKVFGSEYGDAGESVVEDPDGSLLIAGDKSIPGGGQDVWLLKLSASGVLQWQKTHGEFESNESSAAVAAHDGGYLLAGSVWPGGQNQVLLMKVNDSGDLVWQKTLGYGVARTLDKTDDGGYLVGAENGSSFRLMKTDKYGSLDCK